MKSGMLIPLLLLSLVIHEAQAMRFIRKGILQNGQQSMSHVRSSTADEDVVEDFNSLWRNKHFSGRARKLMNTSSNPTTTTIAKTENEKNKDKKGTKKENMSVDSSSATEQQPAAADETYPDILDIAGMDYSQARRKPPIHN